MSAPRRRIPFLVLAAVALSTAPLPSARAPLAYAEDDPPPRRPNDKKGDGFRFTPPDTPAAPTPKPGPTAQPSKGEPPDAAHAAIARLAGWPGQDGIAAAETLLLMGPEAVDPCLEALAKGDAAVRPGAAWVLGKVGAPVHVPFILRAAAERRNGTRLEVFFEAANELDTALTKKWLFSFLTLDRPVFRARATEFLAGLVTPEDKPRIDGLVNAPVRQAGVRVAGLELLWRTHVPDAVDRILAALGDPHPDVALRASQLIAGSEDPAVMGRLNRIARDGDVRERAYAVLALVERTRRARGNAFEPMTIPALIGRRGLLHPDRLCRAASAVGLAFGALDSTDPSVGPLLDRDVVSVLIETAGGDHFLDYGSLVEPIFAGLRRLSGLDLASTATPWAQWWMESMDGFHARRTLTKISDADVPRARVVFEVTDAAGRRRRTAFAPAGGDAVPDAYVIPVAAFQALVAGLEDAGMFSQPDDQRTLADEHLAIRVGVMNQEKRLVLVPSHEDPRHGTLLARLESLEEMNVWQRYRDAKAYPDAAAWQKKMAEVFQGAAPDVRRAVLAQMVVDAFADLRSDAERAEGLDLLERIGGLTDTQATALLTYAAKAKAFGPVEARIVESVAALGRGSLGEPLVEALARSGTPAAGRLLSKTLTDAGPMRVREAFADPRAGVRSSAATAAADLLTGPMGKDEAVRARLGMVLTEGLKALLSDPDPIVKVRAAASLCILGDAKMLDRLDDIYRDGNTTTRIAVAESLGRIGGSAVQPQLVKIVGEVGPDAAPVRAAALEAMAASRNPDSVRILVFYMLNDGDPMVQQAAETALGTARAEEARTALVDDLDKGTLTPPQRVRVVRVLSAFEGFTVRESLGRLLEDTDPRVVDQAALGLAAQRDGIAVSYLLAILKRPEEPLRQKALEALQDVTSLTLLVTSYDAAAEQYEAWFRLHRQGGDRAWFRDAVAKRGYDATTLAGYVRGEADRAAVPVLLRTIRDEDPVLRRNSDLALRRVTGYALPVRIDRTTTREDARLVADRWAAWWSHEPPPGAPK